MNNNLTTFLQSLKTDLINSLQANGKVATGQTINQITITDEGNKASLQVPAYLQELEKGRGPTSKNAVPGNPTMIQRIKQWCQAKGIPDKFAWAVKKSIDKKGYKGKPGVLSQPLGNDNINLRLNQHLTKMADDIVKNIADSIKLN